MGNNTTFETGATSAAVNELILYTDNTKLLSELRDEFYSSWFKKNIQTININYKEFVTLAHISISRYKNEMGYVNSKEIRDMSADQIKEYCQIYANRFADWKREKELQAKQK